MMLPYEMSTALADQHIRDLLIAARHQPKEPTERSTRLADLTTRVKALLPLPHVPGDNGAGPLAVSPAAHVAEAGPMGCSA